MARSRLSWKGSACPQASGQIVRFRDLTPVQALGEEGLQRGRGRQGLLPDFEMELPTPKGQSTNWLAELKVIGEAGSCYHRSGPCFARRTRGVKRSSWHETPCSYCGADRAISKATWELWSSHWPCCWSFPGRKQGPAQFAGHHGWLSVKSKGPG